MTSEVAAAPRHRRLDEYTALEVRESYRAGDRKERIELLQSVFDAGAQLPYDVACAAVRDSDTLFRAWFARHARELNYSYNHAAEGNADLWSQLRKDPEQLVRLAVLENPANEQFRFMLPRPEDFASLTHVERLAAIRNPRLASNGVPDVVLSIFDPTDTTIVSSPEERADLALAYLTNEEALKRSHDFDYPPEIRYDPVSLDFERERERLWHLAAAFPDATVRWYGLRYLGAKDDWKAEVYGELQPIHDDRHSYQNTERANLRYAILLNSRDRDVKTLALAVDDRDEECAKLARQNFEHVTERRSKTWRVVGHVWIAIQNLLVLAVIAAVLTSGETRFEKILIATVVYLFLTLTGFTMQVFATYRSSIVALDSQFDRIRKLLREERSGAEVDAIARQRDEVRWQFSKANVNYVISSIFLFLAWLVTLFALLAAVV